jgi:hypothetical protein
LVYPQSTVTVHRKCEGTPERLFSVQATELEGHLVSVTLINFPI